MKYTLRLEFSALRDARLPARLSRVRTNRVNRLDDVHALQHATEHDVRVVETRRRPRGDEELRPIRVRPVIRHGQHAGGVVRHPERLVLEFLPVNALPAATVLRREIPTLTHETLDDSMKTRSLVRQPLPTPRTLPRLPLAQRSKFF